MCVGTNIALDPTCPRTCVEFITVLLSEAIKVSSITFGMAAEPSDESKWLKSHYEEAATGDVPTPSKRVKYQMLKDDIELHFPHRTYNDLVVKGFIKEAFPMFLNSFSLKCKMLLKPLVLSGPRLSLLC